MTGTKSFSGKNKFLRRRCIVKRGLRPRLVCRQQKGLISTNAYSWQALLILVYGSKPKKV